MTASERGVLLMKQMYKVINKYFPKLFELMSLIPDQRKDPTYDMSEIITGCIAMFILKETSRNAFNEDRDEVRFRDNYKKIFKKQLPHMDTVHRIISLLTPENLEGIKTAFVATLIEQRLFRSFKLFGKYYTVAVDGTGVNSYEKDNTFQNLLHKTSKNGVVTYYSHVVEAKLVTSSGFCISLGSEWITNASTTDTDFVKQDCEQRAFERLAVKVKKAFPRLPICILADGLYPNKTFMKICQDNDWAYVVVLKDKNLKTLQEDIIDVENKHRHSKVRIMIEPNGKKQIHQKYEWITETLTHAGHIVYWISCTETITHFGKKGVIIKTDTPTRFVNLTNIKADDDNVRELIEAGRMRWKIENEGNNTQKNGGYNLGHLFSRKSFNAYQNYYQGMQIAHILNQLVEKSECIAALLAAKKKLSVKNLWKRLISKLTETVIKIKDIESGSNAQIRLAG